MLINNPLKSLLQWTIKNLLFIHNNIDLLIKFYMALSDFISFLCHELFEHVTKFHNWTVYFDLVLGHGRKSNNLVFLKLEEETSEHVALSIHFSLLSIIHHNLLIFHFLVCSYNHRNNKVRHDNYHEESLDNPNEPNQYYLYNVEHWWILIM